MTVDKAIAAARDGARGDGKPRYVSVGDGGGWRPSEVRIELSEPAGEHVRVEASGALVAVFMPTE